MSDSFTFIRLSRGEEDAVALVQESSSAISRVDRGPRLARYIPVHLDIEESVNFLHRQLEFYAIRTSFREINSINELTSWGQSS